MLKKKKGEKYFLHLPWLDLSLYSHTVMLSELISSHSAVADSHNKQ
jgi:hypothetical protein